MSLFTYYVSLRAEIIELVTGVQNAGNSLFWDNTTQNWVTKQKLERLFAKYLAEAKSFGLLMVTRHGYCKNPIHQDYPISNVHNLHIEYRKAGYIWNGGQFYQGKRNCICPCSASNKLSEHHVIDDIIYIDGSNIDECTNLEAILCDLYNAIDCAGEKMPRSGIREYLLRAILRINDELLPEPVETYISKHVTG